MTKKSDHKLKILYVKDILEERRTVTMRDILERLNEFGIPAERKSVSDDLRLLRAYGLPVMKKRLGRSTAYFLKKSP